MNRPKITIHGRCLLLCLLLAVLCSACASEGPTVEINGASYTVDIADNDATRTRGLMFVDSMPDDHGMLFIFPNSRPRSFWMKNTLIPLDIIYFDSDLELVSVSKKREAVQDRALWSLSEQRPGQICARAERRSRRQAGSQAG